MTENEIARKNLIKILTMYPNLPIIARVYSEVVADDGYAFWYGDVEESSYYTDTLWAGSEKTWSLDDALDDIIEFFELEFPEKLIGDIYDLNDEEIDKWMKKAEKFILSLPWKKYIVLTVMTPDSLQGDDRNEESTCK